MLIVNDKKSFTLNRLLQVLVFVSLSTSAVYAATPHWQGPYVGVFAGGAFANNHISTNAGAVTTTSYFSTGADINAVNNAGTFTNDPTNLIAGLQVGHDWVQQQMVYGVVADYGALPLSSSQQVNNIYPDSPDQYAVYASITSNWLFTLRARLGYQVILPRQSSPSLIYFTAGMALTELNIKNNFSDNSALAGFGGGNTSQNQIGWVAGIGMELLSFGHTALELEYLYVHMPSIKTTNSITNAQAGFGIPAQSLTNSFSTRGNFHTSLLKIALIYRFDE